MHGLIAKKEGFRAGKKILLILNVSFPCLFPAKNNVWENMMEDYYHEGWRVVLLVCSPPPPIHKVDNSDKYWNILNYNVDMKNNIAAIFGLHLFSLASEALYPNLQSYVVENDDWQTLFALIANTRELPDPSLQIPT